MVMETTGRTRFSAPGRHARRSSGVKAVNAPLRCAALAALLLLAVATSVRRVDAGEGALTFVIGAPSGNTVSPYLASMSIVYCWARDAMYSNGTMAAWARRNGLHTARYPAGTASYWNWENPSGIMGHSTLDPAWKGPPAPADQWMSLDEYLDLIDNVGRDVMKPLIGVNYNSHTHYYLSRNASIARAAAQVAHVVARGHTGAFWYVGNEDGAPQHATDIAAHARAMKQVVSAAHPPRRGPQHLTSRWCCRTQRSRSSTTTTTWTATRSRRSSRLRATSSMARSSTGSGRSAARPISSRGPTRNGEASCTRGCHRRGSAHADAGAG